MTADGAHGPAHGVGPPGGDVLDAHQHLWDPGRRTYPFLSRHGLGPLRRRFDVEDLRREVTGTPVRRTVVVQAVGTEEETHDLLAAAAGSRGLVAGVVGWVDLLVEDVADRLAALRAGPVGRLLVGLRHQVEDEPPGWLSTPPVVRGVTTAARAGLAFDLLVRPDQLEEAATLVDEVIRDVPDARLVLDHGAKPPVGENGWQAWADGVSALARREQVVTKLSGLLTLLPPGGSPADLRPTVDHLLQTFGPDRLVVGTDWPVSTLAAGYREVVDHALRWTEPLSADERAAARTGTAQRTYALAPPPAPTTDLHQQT